MEQKQGKIASYLDGLKQLMTNKNYILLMLISICNLIALTTSKTTLSLYGGSFGMNGRTLGMMTGTYYLICLILRPFTGPMMDKLNKKVVLTACFVIKIVSWVIYAFCKDATMFTVARYIDAVAFCLITTCFLAATSMLIDKKAMGTGLALYSAIPGVITFFLPLLSTWMWDHTGGPSIYFLGIVSLVLGIVLIQMLDFSRQEGKVRKQKLSFNDLIYLPAVPVCMGSFFLNLLMTVNDTYLLLMAAERGIANAAIFFSILTGMKLVGSIGFGALSDAFGSKIPLIICCVTASAAAILLGAATNIWMIILAAVLYSFARHGSSPVLQKAATEVAPPERRGAAISTNYFIFDCASTFAGYICAFLFTYFGYSGMYYSMAIFPMIGLIFVIYTYKKVIVRTEEA